MMGAGALAKSARPCRFIGVVKDEEVGPAHFIRVEVDFGVGEILDIVSDCHEECAIVRFDGPSLLSQISCPLFG